MRRKISKGFICISAILILFAMPILKAHAATYNLNVQKYSQEQSFWCWAACAQMEGSYYGRNLSQSGICAYVKGSVINDKASLDEITSALKYTTNKMVSQTGIVNFSTFITSMQLKNPAVLRVGWNGGGGHVYVVSGAREAYGAYSNSLYLIDPIQGHSSGFYGYTGLVNGMTLASGTGKYTHTWMNL